MQHSAGLVSFYGSPYHFSGIHDKAWSHYSFEGKVYSKLPHPSAPVLQATVDTFRLQEDQIQLCCGYVASQSIGKAMLSFGISGLQPG